MKLHHLTYIYGGIALMSFCAVVALFIIAVGQIRQEGAQLSSQFLAMTEQTDREAAVLQLRRTAEETKQARQEIVDAYLAGEGAAVDFLSKLEQIAPQFGIELVIRTLETKPESDSTSWLVITIGVTGPYDSVARFTRYVETLPYRSYVTALNYSSREGPLWEGEIALLVSVRSL